MSTAYRTTARPSKSVPFRSTPRLTQDRVGPIPLSRSTAPLPFPHRRIQNLKTQNLKTQNLKTQNPQNQNLKNQVRSLPTLRVVPLWLRVLLLMQRSSTAIAAVLVVAMLVVYGSTVYTQQLWSKEYRKLKTFQRNERQLVSASEALKTQAAQQAERSGSGLVPQTPSSLLFVQPAAPRAQQSLSAIAPPAAPATASPAGY